MVFARPSRHCDNYDRRPPDHFLVDPGRLRGCHIQRRQVNHGNPGSQLHQLHSKAYPWCGHWTSPRHPSRSPDGTPSHLPAIHGQSQRRSDIERCGADDPELLLRLSSRSGLPRSHDWICCGFLCPEYHPGSNKRHKPSCDQHSLGEQFLSLLLHPARAGIRWRFPCGDCWLGRILRTWQAPGQDTEEDVQTLDYAVLPGLGYPVSNYFSLIAKYV